MEKKTEKKMEKKRDQRTDVTGRYRQVIERMDFKILNIF
jgi:hypothetical protein